MRSAPLLAVLCAAVPLSAQNYTGSYAATNQQGGKTVVTLHQQGTTVTGTIVGNGNTFEIKGETEDEAVVGVITSTMGNFWFEAELDGAELYLTLIEPDQNGQPRYDTAQTLVFARDAQAGAGANPLAGGGNPLAQQDPWVGTFTDGNVTLQLAGGQGSYTGTVQVSGQGFPLAVKGSGTLTGAFTASGQEFPVTLSQSGGSVSLTTGGATYVLQRGGGATNPLASGTGGQAAAPSAVRPNPTGAGQLHDGTPLGQEWAQFLAGKKATRMSSYSSGSSGGYSSRADYHLCPNGQYHYTDESSVSVDVGGAFGSSGGQGSGAGTWRIITQGQAAGIELRGNDGSAGQFLLEYRDGSTYVQGERWYITPSEACGY